MTLFLLSSICFLLAPTLCLQSVGFAPFLFLASVRVGFFGLGALAYNELALVFVHLLLASDLLLSFSFFSSFELYGHDRPACV